MANRSIPVTEEEGLSSNRFWTQLSKEWDLNAIDLDDAELHKQILSNYPKPPALIDYCLNYPNNAKSIKNVTDSPHGIKEFAKHVGKYESIHPNVSEAKRKSVFNEMMRGPPSPKSLNSSAAGMGKIRIPTTKRQAGRRIADSIERICNYIDSIYDSIDEFVASPSGEPLRLIPYLVEGFNTGRSPDISGLSFDDSTPPISLKKPESRSSNSQCDDESREASEVEEDEENEELSNADSDCENCQICGVKVERITAVFDTSFTSSSSEFRSRSASCGSSFFCLSSNKDTTYVIAKDTSVESIPNDFKTVKAFWTRLADSVPPPSPSEKDVCSSDDDMPDNRTHDKQDIDNLWTDFKSTDTSNDNVASPSFVIKCDDPGNQDPDSGEDFEYSEFELGASQMIDSDNLFRSKRFSVPVEDLTKETRDEQPISHYFERPKLSLIDDQQYCSLPLDMDAKDEARAQTLKDLQVQYFYFWFNTTL